MLNQKMRKCAKTWESLLKFVISWEICEAEVNIGKISESAEAGGSPQKPEEARRSLRKLDDFFPPFSNFVSTFSRPLDVLRRLFAIFVFVLFSNFVSTFPALFDNFRCFKTTFCYLCFCFVFKFCVDFSRPFWQL